ncbi:MAG: hypothetical protein KatS3mg101_0465 [Patescibacteria group bacterium]|nr:MAG: hypothetical protein KatS3mg101_0465 [Patescibacteria group bacterium]
MLLSENLNFGFAQISTMRLVFLIGFVFWLFVMWYEARKDGFDDERFFRHGFGFNNFWRPVLLSIKSYLFIYPSL